MKWVAQIALVGVALVLLVGQELSCSPAPKVVEYPPGFDPLELARTKTEVLNKEAPIPSQCYTKTDGVSNPCYTCHTRINGLNEMNDYGLQAAYAFSDEGLTNHWVNLFDDRSEAIAAISDDEILDYVREDNYRALREHLEEREDYQGWVPDIQNLARAGIFAFDIEGFAIDGSWWRAFRYKPFLGTFWPTNGSTDDVMIRHRLFYLDDEGNPNREIYKINLAILEAAVASASITPRDALNREVEPLDQALVEAIEDEIGLDFVDFDDDGTTRIQRLPPRYVGGASGLKVQRFLYPKGTEFLHTVRYVDPDADNLIASRMKEVRYSRRDRPMSPDKLIRVYQAEDAAKEAGLLPGFPGTSETGLINDFGWRYQGFIEAPGGHLRAQTKEETIFCMGCHSNIGVTVDSSFGFPRKVPGARGWGYQDLRGIEDVPQAGRDTPEILDYFTRVRGADEFRANDEALERFFIDNDGDGIADEVREDDVRRAAPGGDQDITYLVTPSYERALALNKAYKALVEDGDFEFGRDPVSEPATQVFEEIPGNDTTALGQAGLLFRDGRMWLDWDWTPEAP